MKPIETPNEAVEFHSNSLIRISGDTIHRRGAASRPNTPSCRQRDDVYKHCLSTAAVG